MAVCTYLVTFLVLLFDLHHTVALRCLSCNGFSRSHQCSSIERCPEGDVCYTESYRGENGENLFHVGCTSTKSCPLTNHNLRDHDVIRRDTIRTSPQLHCTECCHSDLCNAAGCQMAEFPKQRGPVCLDCPQSRDPADCDAISVCHQDEVCYVEEMLEFGGTFYKTSCLPNTDQRCVSPPYNPVEVGRRSDHHGRCFSCCPYDLCNTKCIPFMSSVLTTTPETTQAPIYHGFHGKMFFLMFMRNHDSGYSSLHLNVNVTFLTATSSANIEVITRYNSTFQHVSGPVKYIVIDASMVMRENGKSNKGIILRSDTPVSATVYNVLIDGSTDGYLGLPVESLGVFYIVGTFKPNTDIVRSKYGTSFAVGTPFDNTVINITLSTGVYVAGQYHRKGDTVIVALEKMDTFYIETNTSYQDLTGTRIVSNKPVAVVSGNVCSTNHGCNHLVEYLPPVSKWGSKFIVPPIERGIDGIIRIVSSVNTNVVVTTKTSNKTYAVSTFLDIDTNPRQPYIISSDRPVLVLFFFNATTMGMTVIPSKKQFSNKLVLVSPPKLSYYNSLPFDNYIVVIIRTSDQAGLKLRAINGQDLPHVGSVTIRGSDNQMYSCITVTCNNNQVCSVQHSNSNVMFSVIVYGFQSYEAYAYPANLSL